MLAISEMLQNNFSTHKKNTDVTNRRLSLNLGGEARHLGRGLRSGLRRGITRVGRGANTAAAVIS